MSAPLTAATAVPGAHYLDKSNNLVLFVGKSARFSGMYSLRVVETQRLIDSVPAEYFLSPITDAEIVARKAIAAIKGQPRDVLEPKLEELDDDALDALLVADSRMWVTEAIGRVLDRRRTAKASPVITAAISPAITITAQTDVTIEEIPLVAPPIDDAVLRIADDLRGLADLVPPVDGPPWITSTPDVVPESQVPESGARSTAYMRGRTDAGAGLPLDLIEAIQRDAFPSNDRAAERDYVHGWTEMRDFMADEPEFFATAQPAGEASAEVAPAPPPVAEPAPVVVKIRRPPRYGEKLGALGYPVEVYEAMTAETMRAILEAGTRYVAPAGDHPVSAGNADDGAESAPRVIASFGELWNPIDELVTADLPRSLVLVAEAPLADLLQWTKTEATGQAREEVLDAIQARIAGASDAEHEAADRGVRIGERGSSPACPRCGAEVHWGCPAETGARGSAVCSESGMATRIGPSGPPTCDWRGSVVRLADGDVVLVVPEGERILGPVVEVAPEVAPAPAPQPPPGPAPMAARPTPRPDEDAAAVVLSPAGAERAAAIQAALARLSAAVPGYVAAVEALGALRGLGIEVSIDDDARAEWGNA